MNTLLQMVYFQTAIIYPTGSVTLLRGQISTRQTTGSTVSLRWSPGKRILPPTCHRSCLSAEFNLINWNYCHWLSCYITTGTINPLPWCSSPELQLRKEQNAVTLCSTARKYRVIHEHNLGNTEPEQGLQGVEGRQAQGWGSTVNWSWTWTSAPSSARKATQNILKMLFSASGYANWSVCSAQQHSDEKRLTGELPQDTVLKNKNSSFCHEENWVHLQVVKGLWGFLGLLYFKFIHIYYIILEKLWKVNSRSVFVPFYIETQTF